MKFPIQPEVRRGVLSRAAAHILNTTAAAWSLSVPRHVGQVRPEAREVFADFVPSQMDWLHYFNLSITFE